MFPLEFKYRFNVIKSRSQKKLYIVMKKLFIAIHWLSVIAFISASFFTGVSDTDVKMWDMSLYCDEEIFNQVSTPINRKWPVVTIIVGSGIVVALMMIEMCICGPTARRFVNILSYFLGYLLAWDFTYVLQNLVSYPIPSFYQNLQLKELYCFNNSTISNTRDLIKLDKDSRRSFPSYLTCACAYISVFLFMISCYYDKKRSFSAKYIALIIPGGVTFMYGFYLCHYNENHLQDVIVGALIGSFVALHIAKNILFTEDIYEKNKDEYISVIMGKEISYRLHENINRRTTRRLNRYDISIFSDGSATLEQQVPAPFEMPPPYTSLPNISIQT